MEPVDIKTVADREEEFIHEKETVLYQHESGRILRADNKALKKETKIKIEGMEIFMRMSCCKSKKIMTRLYIIW